MVACSSNKDETYSIKKYQEIKVGEDIPSGKYIATLKNEFISELNICPIENKEYDLIQYGESLKTKLIEENSYTNTYMYEIKLPKGKLITSNVDVILTKK